jgi:methionyl aminopeptidase
MILTSDTQAKILREGGKRLAHILNETALRVAPGIETKELDDFVLRLTEEAGDEPAFLHYQPKGARRPYPASLCVSINDEIVHGIPNEGDRVIKEGDVVSLDFGLKHEGLFTDSAITMIAGKGDTEAEHLLTTTREALKAALRVAVVGNRLGDIGHAVSEVARKNGITVFRELVGHGVGKSVHEEPFVLNFGNKGKGEELVDGLVIAIEPIFGEGEDSMRLLSDGWTYATRDGSRAAHFEHTIIVRRHNPEILTAL